MYVSKTIGYSKDYADSFERVFGKGSKSGNGQEGWGWLVKHRVLAHTIPRLLDA